MKSEKLVSCEKVGFHKVDSFRFLNCNIAHKDHTQVRDILIMNNSDTLLK